MPIGESVQPLVTYDGRVIPKPLDRDYKGEIIPDPSWAAFLKDMQDGKFPKENSDGR